MSSKKWIHQIVEWCHHHRATIVRVAIWLALWRVAIAIEFGVVYLICSSLYFIFTNLSSDGRRSVDGTTQAPSAYAAFNADGYKMSGSMDADQFDAQLRHAPAPHTRQTNAQLPAMARPGASTAGRMTGTGRVLATGAAVVSSTTDDGATIVDYKRKSKMANQPCACGSGKKYKNCCSSATAHTPAQPAVDDEYEKWQEEWASDDT